MRIAALSISFVLLNACTMSTYDSTVYIEGYVRDVNGLPVIEATAEYNGVEVKTDEKGCFFFGGVYPPVELTVEIRHPDYKTFSTTQEYGLYVFKFTLAKNSTNEQASLQRTSISDEEAWQKVGCQST